MPQAIPFAVAYAASNGAAALGASVAAQATIAATAATVASVVAPTALVLGASYAVAKLNQPQTPRPSSGSIERRDPLAPRFYPYGLCKVSGPVVFLETNDHRLLKITVFGSRKLGLMEFIYIDGTGATLDPGISGSDGSFTNWTSGGTSYGDLRTHLGQDDQAADAFLIASYPLWTSDHRLRGIPYVFARLDSAPAANFQEAFPAGEPSFAVVGGVEVYDPRKDSTNGGSGSHRMDDPTTWEFSDNQRLCCLDWLTYQDGYAKSWDRIDWATWVPQIEMADDAISLKDGGTEPRYRLATIVGFDEPKGRVLRRILDAGDQQLFTTTDGLIGSRGGVWQEPTVSLDVSSQPEGSFTHGTPLMDRVNEFQLSAMLPSHDFSEVDLQPYVRGGDSEHEAGIVRRQPLQLLQVPSNGQAQRLAKIRMAKLNAPWVGQIRTGFAGLDAIGEAAINLTFDELDQPDGSFNGPFFIDGKVAFLPDRTGVTFPVRAADPTAYDWNAALEEQDPPPQPDSGSEF